MRILVAGAGGVVGLPLTRELIAQGHAVIGTSRNPDSRPELHDAGATVVRMDAFDLASVEHAIAESRPDAVIHQLTDLSAVDLEANAELRIVGTRNLVDAMRRYGVQRLITQSIAWLYADGDGLADETVPLREATGPSARTIEGVVAMEHTAREIPDHVILRYGKLYGPGTWYSRTAISAVPPGTGCSAATESRASCTSPTPSLPPSPHSAGPQASSTSSTTNRPVRTSGCRCSAAGWADRPRPG